MVLRVNLDEFAATARRMMEKQVAFVSPFDDGTLLTASDGKFLLVAHTPLDKEAVRQRLAESQMEVLEGQWSQEIPEFASPRNAKYVVAISYKSREAMPGLWIDAFPYHPTQADALKAMYDEFIATGEMREVSFDDFFKNAHPNVMILPIEDVEAFARKKEDC